MICSLKEGEIMESFNCDGRIDSILIIISVKITNHDCQDWPQTLTPGFQGVINGFIQLDRKF